MAISLNDHESRIKALENHKALSGTVKTVFNTPTTYNYGQKSTIDFTEYKDYDFVGIGYTLLEKEYATTDNIWFKTVPISMLKLRPIVVSDMFGPQINDYEGFVFGLDNNILKFHIVGYGTAVSLHYIFALKLYYNFSYNIYRLTNSISFHFFKCLINSFKGGVKEIWQLV